MDLDQFTTLVDRYFRGSSNLHQSKSGGVNIQNFRASVIIDGVGVGIELVQAKSPPSLWDALLVPSPGSEKEARGINSAEEALRQLASVL